MVPSSLTPYYKGKTILVTGGAGAIGANLVRALLAVDVRHIYIIDNLSSGSASNIDGLERTTLIKGDIEDINLVGEVFKEPIQVVFHLAAFFANQNSVDHPQQDARTNILGTINLLEHSRDHKVELFVYVNTSCMYDSYSTDWSESSKNFRYSTPYSISKFTGEQYAKFFYKYYKLPVVSARVFNSYGPYEYGGKYRNVIPNFFEAALKGESLVITGTGNETRSFAFVDDTVRGLLLAGSHYDGSWQVYNIGSTKETKIIDLATKINTLTANKAPIMYAPRRSWDTSLRRKPDVGRARSRLGYKAVVELDEGLRKTYEWFLSVTP